VLNKVIRSLQMGFTDDFVANCPLNRNFYSSNFDSSFLSDCTDYFMFFKVIG